MVTPQELDLLLAVAVKHNIDELRVGDVFVRFRASRPPAVDSDSSDVNAGNRGTKDDWQILGLKPPRKADR